MIPLVNHRAPHYVQTLIENSFAVRGTRLFDAISRQLRDFRGSLLTFKRKLDVFLVDCRTDHHCRNIIRVLREMV